MFVVIFRDIDILFFVYTHVRTEVDVPDPPTMLMIIWTSLSFTVFAMCMDIGEVFFSGQSDKLSVCYDLSVDTYKWHILIIYSDSKYLNNIFSVLHYTG